MKNKNTIALFTAGWLLIIGALNINTLNNETIFGLTPDFFKGILIGLSIVTNTIAIIKLMAKSKQTIPKT